MSELTNRAAYLKGMADGMNFDATTNEGKLISGLLELVSDLADKVDAIDSEQDFILDMLDETDEIVDTIAEEVFADEEYDEDEEMYSYECQNCGEEFLITEDDIYDEIVVCPYCGTEIEFDFEACDGNCEACDEDCNDVE